MGKHKKNSKPKFSKLEKKKMISEKKRKLILKKQCEEAGRQAAHEAKLKRIPDKRAKAKLKEEKRKQFLIGMERIAANSVYGLPQPERG